MAGQRVPVVLVPRYTTYVGQAGYTTFWLNATDYESVELTAWRGPLVGTGASFHLFTEETTDRQVWSLCPGGQDEDPGQETEALYSWQITKGFFRLRINLEGTDPGVTCWVQGFFIKRER